MLAERGSALAPSDSGSGFSSSRRRPPPSSCRLTQPAGMGRDRLDQGGHRALGLAGLWEGCWGFPWGRRLKWVLSAGGGGRSSGKGS